MAFAFTFRMLRTAAILGLFASVGWAADNWIQLQPTGEIPEPTDNPTVVYSPTSNRLIVFGGSNASGLTNNAYILTFANGLGGAAAWESIAHSGAWPSPRTNTRAVYDDGSDRMIVYAGRVSGGLFSNEVWVLSNASGASGTPQWTLLSPISTPPPGRSGHSVVYDSASNRLIVFGGCVGDSSLFCFGSDFVSDVWVLTNANGLGGAPEWIPITPAGPSPPGRFYGTAQYDPSSNRMIVFGGRAGPTAYSDSWVLTDANGIGTPAWQQLVPTMPTTDREVFGAGYDPDQNRMFVVGGVSQGQLTADVWALEAANALGSPSWSQIFPQGPAPAARYINQAGFDAQNSRLMIFGGSNASLLNDVWIFAQEPDDNEGPLVSSVLANPNPVEINTAITLTANVDDSTTGGSTIASAEYAIDGGVAVSMAAFDAAFDDVSENVTAVIPGQQTGVFEVCVKGMDSAGNTGAAECIFLPVYDPNGGFVTGGGWVNSPGSADLENGASGKANFGFVSKYKKGQNTPVGNLQFQFNAGDITFHSTSMEWLVVTGQPRAMFRGEGLLNGEATCKFEVDAWDESFSGEDAFGLKLFACGPGADVNRYALPATALGGGSIKIHQN